MIIPFSTALTLARPPLVSYAVTLLCVIVFYLQISYPITEVLMYYPNSWNPLKMISSALAHADLMHLVGNMIFFLAFAPALETLIANKIRYIWIMLVISFVVSISYSISIYMAGSEDIPTLGFSGVVMGMIGLSAYLMPLARIRVFWWYVVFWKVFYVPAWVLAVAYIGLDSWEMLTSDNFAGVNVVAHVAGGLSGYLYGYIWLKQRKQETRKELADEIEEMKLEKQFGKSNSMSFRGRKELQQQQALKEEARAYEKFMHSIHQKVTIHQDSEAVLFLIDKYNDRQTDMREYEALFARINEWGPSRTLLCMGRLIINRLDREKRYGRAIVYIEKCQIVSAQFILPDISRTIFYTQFAIEVGKLEVARKLLADPEKRYAGLVDKRSCTRLNDKLNMVDHGLQR